MKTVAVIGTNGIPASYGGFETLAEHLVRGLAAEFKFIVYCPRTPGPKRRKEHLGARLVYLPFRANGWQAPIYDAISTVHAFFAADVLLVLGPVFGFFFPFNFLFKRSIVVNYGGLNEWDRPKYSRSQRFYAYLTYWFAARFASLHVADNTILKESMLSTFGASCQVIRYGGDHAGKAPPLEATARHTHLDAPYFVSVSRAQVDNNIHLLIEAFLRVPGKRLVVVSNWNVSEYGRVLRKNHSHHTNITLLDAIYDPRELDHVRSGACAYIHSHSYCGTAPSLVEAICLGLPVLCFDVPTNRESTQCQAVYFSNVEQLVALLGILDETALAGLKASLEPLANGEYRWQEICAQYRRLFSN